MSDKEREHCEAVAYEVLGTLDTSARPIQVKRLTGIIKRERAAARDEALEEAAELADAEAIRCSKEAARKVYEERDVWTGRAEQASELTGDIRALKVKP